MSPYKETVPQWIQIEIVKKNILTYGDLTCEYCHRTISSKSIHFDHRTPRAKGGRSSLENMTISCKRCNHWKKDKNYIDFIKILANTSRGRDACLNEKVITGLKKHIEDINDFAEILKNKINESFVSCFFCQDCILRNLHHRYCKAGRDVRTVKSCKWKKSVTVCDSVTAGQK
jgi:hypothetical protein